MAGLVVGVLSNLKSPVLNEFWLLWGVGEDKDKLQSNLERINAVLQDAERRQVNDMAVKDWLRKIKAAAHDAEDVLDEFRIEALQRKVENEEADCCGIPLEKVCNLISLPVFHIKMAHKMKKLRKDFEEIAKEKSLFHFTVGVVDIQPPISRARETCSAFKPKVYGRGTEKADLIDLLIKSESGNEEDLSVIPIVGMGGLGKTTLAQLVYNDEQVVTHFKELRMWVYVSENFDVGMLLKAILQAATDGPTEQLSMELLQNRLQKELSGKRYLLVLDDVWNVDRDKWHRLKASLTCGAHGSKLLVTTRHDAVAKIMHAVSRPPLGTLSEEESWNLFQKLANPPPMCEAIGREIVKKCDGLPLAITTLVGLMSTKETVSAWESVRDSSNLWKPLPEDNGGGILPILQLSYDHLTPPLKQCFAFCAVIPKGHEFVKQRLIKQWIALGFIHSDEENELLEEKAEGYFNQLLQRSLFQGSYLGYYKMHDLIHDLVRFVAEKECFIVKASTDSVPKETRHLTVHDDKWATESGKLEELKKCEKLRSLSIYGCRFVDINAVLSLTCLRVLDLRRTFISCLPNSIGKLKHLRYLDVSGTCITELPETICNLHSLQTLIIRDTKIRMLPKNMRRMISLRHIELSNLGLESNEFSSRFPLLPKGFGELTCLRTLSTFKVGEESGPGIEELNGLNLLCGDFCIKSLNHVRNGECAGEANLKAKKHLRSLKLSWSSDDGTTGDKEGNSPPSPPPWRRGFMGRDCFLFMGRWDVCDWTSFPLMWHPLKTLFGPNRPPSVGSDSSDSDSDLPPSVGSDSTDFYSDLPPSVLPSVPPSECVSSVSLGQESHDIAILPDSHDIAILPDFTRAHEAVIENLEPHSSLKTLAVESYEGMKFPNWMKMLTNLTDIKLFRCEKCEHLPPLWRLPFLESLFLDDMSAVKYIVELDGSDNSKDIFSCLKYLELHNMSSLEGWSSQQEEGDGDEQGSERDAQVILQGLRTLSISDCPNLTSIPWLRHVSSLTSLYISFVGLDMIEIPASQSLRTLSLSDMFRLYRWSVQEADDGQMIFGSLSMLRIRDCEKLICLPPFLLPALVELEMSTVSCHKIEFSTSHSLRRVHLRDMAELERLSLKASNDNEDVVLCPFINFCVAGCPRMTQLPHRLASSIRLTVSADNELLLKWAGANYTSLSELDIEGSQEVKHLPKELEQKNTSLRKLRISNCPKLISLSNQLENLLALKELIVKGCNDLVLSLPDGSQQQRRSPPPLNSLQVLEIINSCENQISLPGDGIVLTSLKSLKIVSCRNLESISADMLQNLTSLEIKGCRKLWSSLVSLENLKSIKLLTIAGCPDMTRLLGSMENLTSLTFLGITNCPGMWSLPESVKNLKSLIELRIEYCRGISSLPESMGDLTVLDRLFIENCPGITTLPYGLKRLRNLYKLEIHRCPPVLKRKLRFPKGQDWHKVAHVPYISIDWVDPRTEESTLIHPSIEEEKED